MARWKIGEKIASSRAQPQAMLASRPLIDHIMREADRFVAAAPQHDDMTVVVVRCVSVR